MWSAKKILIGGLAVGGAAAVAGYFAYRYYKKKTVYPEVIKQEENEGDDEGAAVCVQHSEKDILDIQQDHDVPAKENAKADEETVEFAAEKNMRSDKEEPVKFGAEGTDKKDDAESVEFAAVERTGAEPVHVFPPSPRPSLLRHVKTLKELDVTFEALSAYLFTQDRTAEELKEAEKELGWVWYAALGYRHRLPNNVPILVNEEVKDNALPLENEDGMQSVD